MMTSRALSLALMLASPVVAGADTCPAIVTDAAKKAVPSASVVGCVAEKSGFEVKMQRRDKSIVELAISAKGEIEEIEEEVAVSSLPALVTKAFAARYPKASILKAAKLTKPADKRVAFELAFKVDNALKEATFEADGKFVEEE